MGNREYKLTLNQKAQIDYVKTIITKNLWYYRDRINIPRGPCDLNILKRCWINGIIDQNTLIWGPGFDTWLPVKNVRTLIAQIRTLEVQLATLIKKEFVLKPHINEIRRLSASRRNIWLNQLNYMQ